MRTLLALSLLAFACGDPLVDTSYRGDPIWYVEGTINAPDLLDGLELGSEVRASLFWMPNLTVTDQLVLLEQTSVTAEVRFPATFEVRVYEVPEEDAYVTFDGRYAAAMLLIYVDEDGDGFYSGNDRVVGGTTNKVLVFARDAVAADQSPSSEEIPIGFSLIQTPLFNCPQTDLGEQGRSQFDDVYFPSCAEFMCPEDTKCNEEQRFLGCIWDYPLTITVFTESNPLQPPCLPAP